MDKNILADLRLYIGYSGFDQKRLNDTHRQQLQEAEARLKKTQPTLLLNCFMAICKNGLTLTRPEISYTQKPEKSEPPAHRR